jgi:signal transduction histidine kinase/CheY-like chemotaxis protein
MKIETVLALDIANEQDIVRVRQGARHLAELLGFERQDQTRIATAASEIARNTLVFAGGGRAEFSVRGKHPARSLLARFSDSGPGIANLSDILEGRYVSSTGMGLGIAGTRRLMDTFAITSPPGGGTVVEFSKIVPPGRAAARTQDIAARLSHPRRIDLESEVAAQDHDLLNAMSELVARHKEVSQLNAELEDTNRGVMALYAELDQRAEDLRRASDVKTRFLSNMSHEFRTPLNSIMALSRILLDRTDGDLSPEQERQVRYIRQSAQSLAFMVNDLLDIAKVEAGRIDVTIGEFSVAELFGALRGVMRPLLHNEAVELVLAEPATPAILHTDEGKVSQILRNLVANALKFTEQGEIRVSAHAEEGGRIAFEVSDTGIGIASQDIERIFDEFTQLPGPLQARSKGSGLGLPLSRRLAELLGGTLGAGSEPGKGSTFRLVIPADLRTLDGPSRSEATVVAQRRVLIVDDSEMSRYVLRQMLAGEESVALSEAGTGTEGLRLAQLEQPDLVLLDLDLPGLDGFEVFRTLRGDPATRHIPIVVVTSTLLQANDERRLAGAAGILSKETLSRPVLSGILSDVWSRIGAAG